MNYYLNYHANPAVCMSFDNGWSVSLSSKSCGHIDILIVPTKILIDPVNLKQDEYYSNKAMKDRGDYYECFEGSDSKLLDIIAGVRSRPIQEHLQIVNDMIDEAVAKHRKE